MANRIRTGRDGICSLWNFISRRTMKAFEEEEQRRYTHSLSLPFTSSLCSTFVVLPVLFFFFFFFFLLFVTSPVDIDLAIHRERCLYAYQ